MEKIVDPHPSSDLPYVPLHAISNVEAYESHLQAMNTQRAIDPAKQAMKLEIPPSFSYEDLMSLSLSVIERYKYWGDRSWFHPQLLDSTTQDFEALMQVDAPLRLEQHWQDRCGRLCLRYLGDLHYNWYCPGECVEVLRKRLASLLAAMPPDSNWAQKVRQAVDSVFGAVLRELTATLTPEPDPMHFLQ